MTRDGATRTPVAALLMLLVALAVPSDRSLAAEGATGALRVTVYDGDFNVPLAQVRVSLLGTTRSGLTTGEGTLLLGEVPAGIHTLSFSKEGFERRILPDVAVTQGQIANVRIELTQEVIELEELVVTGVQFLADSEIAALEVRAAAVNLQDTVSTELISKAGAGDVAGALKLVVGASVSEGKYATVRGMSDRYTGATLNGVRVPSADPRRRAVQIDLFPTGTIEGVDVSKTFTPDLQGDFTGGGVDIRTKSIPEGRVLSVSFSGEYNAGATGNERFLTYDGGGVPATGFAGGERDRPGVSNEPLPSLPRPSANPNPADRAAAEAYDRMVRAFRPVMGTRRDAPGADFGASVVGGNRWTLDDGLVVGFLGALTYSRKHDLYLDGTNATGSVSTADQPDVTLGAVRSDSKGTDEVLLGFLSNLVIRPSDRHELAFRLIGNQAAEDSARFQLLEIGFPTVEQNQSLQYTQRTVGSAQLHGEHEFANPFGAEGSAAGPVSFDWTASYNLTRQNEPDVRFFRNYYDSATFAGEQPPNSTDYGRTRRIWREVSEDNTQASANIVWPFVLGAERSGRVKAGLFDDRSDRDTEQRSFFYSFVSPQIGSSSSAAIQANRATGRFQGGDAGALWTDVFLDPDRIGFASNRCGDGQSPFRAADNCSAPNQLLWVLLPAGTDVDYAGEQRLGAAYAMADVPLFRGVKLLGGVRRESTSLTIDPTNPVSGLVEVIEVGEGGDRSIVRVSDTEGTARIRETLWLPALSAVWEVRPRMNLRFAWSRTLARPTFRELAPVATDEFLAGDEFLGNPDLALSRIRNFDLRWEWFRRGGEVFAASLFHKRLEAPIELIGFQAGGRSFVQPVNYDEGEVRGAEVEVRYEIAPFTIGANYALIRSEVEVPAAERQSLSRYRLDESSRRLQGQPSYLFNAFVDYENARTGTTASLFYNVTGEVLLTGAATGDSGGTPSVLADRVPVVVLTVRQKLPRNASLGLKITNLLPETIRTFYRAPGRPEANRSERDTFRQVSLSVGAKW